MRKITPLGVIAAVASVFVFYWLTMILVERVNRPTIESSTEQKYLRNLDKYSPINESQFYVSYNHDTLGYIAKIAFSDIDPFRKWYIEDVGAIPRTSELSRKLDSMIKLYVKQPSKYK